MIVKCIANIGKYLRAFEDEDLPDDHIGKFGATGLTILNELEIDKEYLVMAVFFTPKGVINYLLYLDDYIRILPAPAPLFLVTDAKVSNNWYFHHYPQDDELRSTFVAVMGYKELATTGNHFMELLEREAELIFYRRVIAMEQEFQWKA